MGPASKIALAIALGGLSLGTVPRTAGDPRNEAQAAASGSEVKTQSAGPVPVKTPLPAPTPTRTAFPPPPPRPDPTSKPEPEPKPKPEPEPKPEPRASVRPVEDNRPIVMRDADLPLYVENEIILFVRAAELDRADIAARYGLVVLRSATLAKLGVTMITARIPAGQTVEKTVATLEAAQAIEWAQPNYIYQLLGNTRQPGFAMHGLDPDTALLTNGLPSLHTGARIVLIDSPVDRAHPGLSGAAISQVGDLGKAPPSPHGTAIAELLVGQGDFPGVAQGAELISIPAFNPVDADDWHALSTSTSDLLIAALDEARAQQPDVINLSFGSPTKNDEGVARQLGAMHSEGICIAAAAGNGGADSPVRFPARMRETIAVAAVNALEAAYQHGSRGPEVDIAAWGVEILAAVPGGRRIVSGTSFAAPLVAGAMLRMPACGAAKRPDAVRAALTLDAKDLGESGRDTVFGAGLFRFGQGALDSATLSDLTIAQADAQIPANEEPSQDYLKAALLAAGGLLTGLFLLLLWRKRRRQQETG